MYVDFFVRFAQLIEQNAKKCKKKHELFGHIKKMLYLCRRFRRLMTSLLCNSCNYREISSSIKTRMHAF